MSSARKLWSYQCEWDGCSKSFKSISAFEAHYRRHTNPHPYTCDSGSCSEAFHNQAALDRHRRTHPDERTFACEYQSRGQSSQNTKPLDQHHYTHTAQCDFICKYDSCGQAFHDRGELTKHHRTHRQRPLACKYDSCSRTFARKEFLEAHMHMHTKERSLSCSYEGCNKSFCHLEGLMHHENDHINRNRRKCSYESCNDALDNLLQLRRHENEEQEIITHSVTEVRPIRLRLTQPKRQNPEALEGSPRKRLLLHPPKKEIRSDSLSPDLKKTHEGCSESNHVVSHSITSTVRGNVHQEARSSTPSMNTSSNSKASTNHEVFNHGSHHTLSVIPYIPKLGSRPQAPTLQRANEQISAEKPSHTFGANEISSDHQNLVSTSVCGVYSTEKRSPEKIKAKRGRYHCPRCDTQFTRSRAVRGHFGRCITMYGNPDRLKWTDHPSLEATAKFFARNGNRVSYHNLLTLPADVTRNSRGFPKDAPLRPLAPKPPPLMVEDTTARVEPVSEPLGRDVLQERDIVRPICKPRDALRRSKYNPETIARDFLLATGSHPNMDPLNAHLDVLRNRFSFVNDDSNMSTFRWDLVDPERDLTKGPERGRRKEYEHGTHIERQAEPEKAPPSSSKTGEASNQKTRSKPNNVATIAQPRHLPISLPSRPSTKPVVSDDDDVPFRIIIPDKVHFGPMSTMFTTAFSRDDPVAASLLTSNEGLWTAIFTLLEYRHDAAPTTRTPPTVRVAVNKRGSDILGWMAFHVVDPSSDNDDRAMSMSMSTHPSTNLDWTTAAPLLPPQLSRFLRGSYSGDKEKGKKKEHPDRDRVPALASTIRARATEAQQYLLPIRKFVINALVVHPQCRSRGVGLALLNSITKIADKAGLPVWIQAPPPPPPGAAPGQGGGGGGLFRRAGFECVGELNLDLDSFAKAAATVGNGKGVQLGGYKRLYMVRWPRGGCSTGPKGVK